MLPEILAAFLLLALCVLLHATGLSRILRYTKKQALEAKGGPWKNAWLIVRVSWCLTALHLSQILLWAVYYRLEGCLPDFETAVYFSGVSYSTLGYGDVVLPQQWRILGPTEGLTGILMCGLSTGLFFAIFHHQMETRANERHSKP